MKNRVKGGLIAVAACVIVSLCGCSQSAWVPETDARTEAGLEKIELEVFYSRDDITWLLIMGDLCSKFESKNPDTDLELQDGESGVYEESLKAKEALDEFPDLSEIQNVDGYVASDRLGSMPPSISSLIEEPVYRNGTVYIVPLYITTCGIIYNQVLLKKYYLQAPQTHEEFLEICRTLSSHGVVPLVCSETKEDSIAYWLNYFYQRNVLPRVGEQGICFVDFTAPGYMDMPGDLERLMDSRYVLKDSVYTNGGQIISQLLDPQIAMYYTESSFIANIILADPDCMSSTKDNMGVEIEDDSGTARLAWFFVLTGNGDMVVIREIDSQLATSKECAQDPARYQAAERFLKFLFEDENYRGILKSMYGPQTMKERVLYPAPSMQQYLIIDYCYARKEESFLDVDHISGSSRGELSKALCLLLGHPTTVEETARYSNTKWSETSEEEKQRIYQYLYKVGDRTSRSGFSSTYGHQSDCI